MISTYLIGLKIVRTTPTKQNSCTFKDPLSLIVIPRIVYYEMRAVTGTNRCGLCLQLRSRKYKCEENNMASDLEEEMVSESESSVDINDLLPREGHVSFNQYGSIVAENESPENQEIVEEAEQVLILKW